MTMPRPGWRRWPPALAFPALVALAAVLGSAATLEAQYQREPPDFGGSYVFPTPTHPEPHGGWLRALDAGLIALGLGVAAWLILVRRSRVGALALAVASLAYFGFYREGCVCPIGAVQNVALALADPGHAASPAVLAVFVLPLAAALLFGRVFCGGVCPHGAIQEILLLRPVRVPRGLDRALGLLKYIYLALAVLFAARGIAFQIGSWHVETGRRFVICEWDPFIGIFRLTGSFTLLAIGGAFLLASLFIGRPYCRWLCPYGALLGIASRVAWKNVQITPDRELDCGLCAEACPYGAIRDLRAVRSTCLACARCYESCPRQRETCKKAAGAPCPVASVEAP